MPVGDYCRRPAATIAPDDSVRAAAERMEKGGLGCLIVAENGKPVGILTDRDVALGILCKRLDAGAVSVSELAARSPLVIEQDAPLAEAARMIRRHGIRRLPVVDKKGELVGVIAADDLMQLVVSELESLAPAVRKQNPAAGAEA